MAFAPFTLARPTTERRSLEFVDQETEATKEECELPPAELLIWEQVNAELRIFENIHHYLWWRQHCGKQLAILLHHAGYTTQLQRRNLRFFAHVVAPCLGASPLIQPVQGGLWQSFMTDDGTPVEMSWDWGTKDSRPMIRYSIEPIGIDAGTLADPDNVCVGHAFLGRLVHALPCTRLEWFNHFRDFFNVKVNEAQQPDQTISPEESDHRSSIFYAFDLSPKDTSSKVYFFPKYRAAAMGQSHWDTVFDAIQAAPHCHDGNLQASAVLRDFYHHVGCAAKLECDMLAIDLVDPLDSRLKIYFRCRATTFESVSDMMTLRGRIATPKLHEGLEELRRLWSALFGNDAAVPTSGRALANNNHRTAGVLYNVEFRLGDLVPRTKIYIPVRHYASSDDAVMRALGTYFVSAQRGRYMLDYVNAMRMLLSGSFRT